MHLGDLPQQSFPSGTQYAIVNTLPEGRRVIVLTEADANGWVEITAGDCDGYVKLEYLKAE